MPAKNTICLWYDGTAEEAARFYAATFPDSSVDAIHRAPADYPAGKKGEVLVVDFTVLGIPCMGLNGGPEFKHSEAFSFQVMTEDQAETDRYWNAIVGNGGAESECGWCKDKWGLSWQITPRVLIEAWTDSDPGVAKRAFEAMMTMQKIDVAKIEAARAGDFARMAFPNESPAYRAARDALLDAEIALRRQTEAVAAMRRALPPGGEVLEDYAFERIGALLRPEPVKLSELFGEHATLLLYSFMFGPERDQPCPGCTHLLDGVDGAARHVPQRAALYVVAKSPIARLAAWAHARGWNHLKLLSTAGNDYDAHYYGDTAALTPAMRAARGYEDGKVWDEPMLNVFVRDGGTIRHFWGSELVFAPEDPGEHHRGLDFMDTVWGLLDTTPEGRGTDWFPELDYAGSGGG